MTDLSATIKRVERLVQVTGQAESTVSRKVFKDGKRLARLRATNNCTLGLLRRAQSALDILEKEAGLTEPVK